MLAGITTKRSNINQYIMEPIASAYHAESPSLLEKAIFPSFFHGKCQRFSKDGSDPPGCPNPDCPVVCGTPGSMVHFYSTLRYIAFNSTKTLLESLTTPGNPAFEETSDRVKRLMLAAEKRELDDINTEAKEVITDAYIDSRNSSHAMASTNMPDHGEEKSTIHSRLFARQLSSFARHHSKRHLSRKFKKSATAPPGTVAPILAQFDPMFDKECGGNTRDAPDGLPKCSWEKEMKRYILSFP